MADQDQPDKPNSWTEKLKKRNNLVVKITKMYNTAVGHNYNIAFNTSKSTTVAITNNLVKKSSSAYSILRLDKAHGKTKFNHININHRISGVRDPHIPLPTGGLTAGKTVARFCKVFNTINEIVVPIAVTIDCIQTGIAVKKDYQTGTTRNTVEKAANVAGTWGGGYGGAMGGAALGTALFPGVGTIIGGICGAVGGAVGGSYGASYIANRVGDSYNYDLISKACQRCCKEYKVRKYLNETEQKFCSSNCEKKEECKII